MHRHDVAIPDPDKFVAREEYSVFEWARLYLDLHPAVASMDRTVAGQEDRLRYLGVIPWPQITPGSIPVGPQADGGDWVVDTTGHYAITYAVYQELADDIETGRLEPKRRVYLEDRRGKLDPTLCVLEAAPILTIAERRGDGGEVIQTLLAARCDPDPRKTGESPSDEGPKTDHRSSRGSRRRGRIPNPIWSAAKNKAIEWLDENGFPRPGDGGQAALEKHIADWLAPGGHYPAESTVRRHVSSWIDEYRAHVSLTS